MACMSYGKSKVFSKSVRSRFVTMPRNMNFCNQFLPRRSADYMYAVKQRFGSFFFSVWFFNAMFLPFTEKNMVNYIILRQHFTFIMYTVLLFTVNVTYFLPHLKSSLILFAILWGCVVLSFCWRHCFLRVLQISQFWLEELREVDTCAHYLPRGVMG